MTTNYDRMCFVIASLEAADQEKLFSDISEICTEDQITALKIGVAYMHLLIDKDFRDAVKTDLASQLYREFTNGK